MLDQIFNSPLDAGLEAPLVLLILVVLEAVLSADNAIALAAIAQGLEDEDLQRRALNFGLVAAYVLRVSLILTATWVVQFWQFELLGAAYLLWLVFQHFTSATEEDDRHHGPRFTSLWQAIPIIAVTDLAFSLDSVTTAIAISDQTWLVLTGGTIGVITLRFMAGLFIRWLKEYAHLEDAGYITVAFVGLRLLLRALKPEFVPPESLMIAAIALVFVWGFSKRNAIESPSHQKTDVELSTENKAHIESLTPHQTKEAEEVSETR
jgi:YkoY family integral membrane protein